MESKTEVVGRNRRQILKSIGLAGAVIPLRHLMPEGLVPAVEAAGDTPEYSQDKNGLTVLGDRPINMETPPHLLDDAVTPANRLFVRNNGIAPFPEDIDAEKWRLQVDGEVENTLSLSIDDLKSNFETITLNLQIECGGNGRRFFTPGASGNQWTFGAVGCPRWTGVRFRDVLNAAGVKPSAVYTGHYGADMHLSGDPDKAPISRGVPIEKAMEEHSIIAWAMNSEELPILNGYPLRLIVPGWPGSCSQKWLTRVWVRDQVHDGPKMDGKSYRVPAYPVAPGTKVPDEDMKIIESMPVKSVITAPQTGAKVRADDTVEIRGHAWAGDLDVSAVDISIDFGASWQKTALSKPVNKYAWQQWSAYIKAPALQGYYEVWARATDSNGIMQPATTPGWNPKGYLNNMQHRIALFVV